MACQVETRPAHVDPMLPERFGILRVRRDIRDTFTLELAPSNGVARRAAAPGQFNTLIP